MMRYARAMWPNSSLLSKKGPRSDLTLQPFGGTLATLSSMLAFAERSGWVAQNPMTRFDKRGSCRKPNPEPVSSPYDEYRRLLAASGPLLRPLIEMAVATGMRLEELLSLKWDQVDLDARGSLGGHQIQAAKGGPTISPCCGHSCSSREKRPGQAICVHEPNYRQPVQNHQEGPSGLPVSVRGVQDIRFHDLRHTFASWAVQAGADLYRLSRILGHASLQMTSRYAHLATEHLHQVVETLATPTATELPDSAVGSSRVTLEAARSKTPRNTAVLSGSHLAHTGHYRTHLRNSVLYPTELRGL